METQWRPGLSRAAPRDWDGASLKRFLPLITAQLPNTVLAVALNVKDKAQVDEVVGEAEKRLDSIDVLVNNAGYGYRAAVEEGDDQDVADLFANELLWHRPASASRSSSGSVQDRLRGPIAAASENEDR